MRMTRVLRDGNLWHGIALVGLLIFAIYVRTANLAWNPGWYPDEGSDLNIAHNLAQGRAQYFAIGGTPLIAARVPLYHLLLMGAFQLWGYDIGTARWVVALAGLATIFLLYVAARRMVGARVALLAVAILTIMPNALVYQRLAFAYNVQALFFVLGWWALWEFSHNQRARWLGVATLAASAAYMTALTGVALIASVALVTAWSLSRRVGMVFLAMCVPGALYLATLWLYAPAALAQDLALIFNRTGSSLPAQLFDLVSNYTFWLEWTVWIALGIAGLFLLAERRARVITQIVFFATMVNAMRMLPGDLSFHRYLELLPFIALGAANFVLRAWSFLIAQWRDDWQAVLERWAGAERFTVWARRLYAAAMVGLLFAPLVWMSAWDYYFVSHVQAPRSTKLDAVLASKPADAVAATDFVNARVRRDEVVLASPTVAWRVHARAADFEQMLAFDGVATENYGAGVPRTRFVFEPTLANATYVIVDNLWRGWATQRMPPLQEYTRIVESWTVVFKQGEFVVYRNPAR